MVKLCVKCTISKPINNFYKNSNYKDGIYTHCKSCHKQYTKEWTKRNLNKVAIKNKAWVQRNPEYHNNLNRIKRKTNILFKLADNLRSRLRCAIKGNSKKGSAIRDLGCTITQLRSYLESKFQPGMSWDNYGKWHIDHIIPLSKVDLTNYDELKKVCNYTNLQPLWAKENLSKGNK